MVAVVGQAHTHTLMSKKLRKSYRLAEEADREIKRVAELKRKSEAGVIEGWAEESAGKKLGGTNKKTRGAE